MILYNVTYGIDKEIETDWIRWMQDTHIPAIMATGSFEQFKLYKVLTHDEESSSSYCVQYFTPDILTFNSFLEHHANALAEDLRSKFKDRHVAFNTLLEQVD